MSSSDFPPPPPSSPLAPTQFDDASSGSDYVPNSEERTLAMLAELLQLFSWIIGPLIIYLVKRDSRFVRFHALQAILWQVVVMFAYILFFVALMVVVFTAASKGGGTPPPSGTSPFPIFWLLGVYALLGLIGLTTIVTSIYFAVKAQGGHWSSYPLIGRLAKSMS